jgi:hypothetical protein
MSWASTEYNPGDLDYGGITGPCGNTAGCFRVIGGDSIKGSWDGGIMAVIGKLDQNYISENKTRTTFWPYALAVHPLCCSTNLSFLGVSTDYRTRAAEAGLIPTKTDIPSGHFSTWLSTTKNCDVLKNIHNQPYRRAVTTGNAGSGLPLGQEYNYATWTDGGIRVMEATTLIHCSYMLIQKYYQIILLNIIITLQIKVLNNKLMLTFK